MTQSHLIASLIVAFTDIDTVMLLSSHALPKPNQELRFSSVNY
jgi:hypothetical protein